MLKLRNPYKSSNMSMLNEIIGMAAMFTGSYMVNQKEWKDRILKQWSESSNYPRKKKKKVRKSLRLEWSVACYDPLNMKELIDIL